jgi:hypothetical protein
LRTTLAGLSVEDRLILRMRYDSNLGVVEIARALQLEQKPLYRRIQRLLAALRSAMEQVGVTAEVAREAFQAHGFDAVGDDPQLFESGASVSPSDQVPAASCPTEETK